jgi:ABC-2 type transport system permease protein
VSINIVFPADTILFYRLDSLLIGLSMSLLAALLIACIGVLVSLRAPTARQAYQRMSLVLIAFWFLPILALQILPDEVISQVTGFLSTIDLGSALIWIGVVLVIADVLLLFVVKARFKRTRLILD